MFYGTFYDNEHEVMNGSNDTLWELVRKSNGVAENVQRKYWLILHLRNAGGLSVCGVRAHRNIVEYVCGVRTPITFITEGGALSEVRGETISRDATIKLWDTEHDEPIRTFPCAFNVCTIRVSSVTNNIFSQVSAASTKLVSTVSSSCGTSITTNPYTHMIIMEAICVKCHQQHFSSHLVSKSNCGTSKSRRTRTHPHISGHTSEVTSACQMSPTTFLSGSMDNTIKLWDINHDEPIRTVGRNDDIRTFKGMHLEMHLEVEAHIGCRLFVKYHERNSSLLINFVKPSSCGTSTTMNPSEHFVGIQIMCGVCVKCHQQHFSPEVGITPSSCGTSTTMNPSEHFKGILEECAVCVKCHQQHSSPEVVTTPSKCGTSTTTKPSAHFVGRIHRGQYVSNVTYL